MQVSSNGDVKPSMGTTTELVVIAENYFRLCRDFALS